MLSLLGWLDGLSALITVVAGCIFGAFFIYKGRQLKATLLAVAGCVLISAGLMFLGYTVDFITILITTTNLDNSNGLVDILNFMWLAPLLIFTMYVSSELLAPEKKWIFFGIFFVLGVIYEITLFMAPVGSFNVNEIVLGEELRDNNINLLSPAGFCFLVALVSSVIFTGFGFVRKSIVSSGVIRKKFLYLSIGVWFWCGFGFVEIFLYAGYFVFLVRMGMIAALLFLYRGLKPVTF
jgi:hypothetical protein